MHQDQTGCAHQLLLSCATSRQRTGATRTLHCLPRLNGPQTQPAPPGKSAPKAKCGRIRMPGQVGFRCRRVEQQPLSNSSCSWKIEPAPTGLVQARRSSPILTQWKVKASTAFWITSVKNGKRATRRSSSLSPAPPRLTQRAQPSMHATLKVSTNT